MDAEEVLNCTIRMDLFRHTFEQESSMEMSAKAVFDVVEKICTQAFGANGYNLTAEFMRVYKKSPSDPGDTETQSEQST